jgi:hypothetical protein
MNYLLCGPNVTSSKVKVNIKIVFTCSLNSWKCERMLHRQRCIHFSMRWICKTSDCRKSRYLFFFLRRVTQCRGDCVLRNISTLESLALWYIILLWWGGSVWTLIFCGYSMWYISLLMAAGTISKKKGDKELPETLCLLFHRFLILCPIWSISYLTNSCRTEWSKISDYHSVGTLFSMLVCVEF